MMIRTINVQGTDYHQVTDIPIVNSAGGLAQSQHQSQRQ